MIFFICKSLNFISPLAAHIVTGSARASASMISNLYFTAIRGGMERLEYKECLTVSRKKYEPELSKEQFIKKKYTPFNESYYEGDFLNGLFHGQGKLFYSNGDCYEGSFVEGKNQGKGKLILSNGDCYEGDFVNNTYHGRGRYTFADGSFYEGDFVNNQYQGQGKFTLADGWSYKGEFFRGSMISSDISHLGDRLFYRFLHRPDAKLAVTRGYNLGILADYLQKNGYEKLGLTLDEAYQLLRIDQKDIQQKSEEICEAFKKGSSQLFLYGHQGHSMGLNFVPDLSTGLMICEIFNSGEGLSKYHEHHDEDFRKYKTMLQIKVPIESVTPEKIKIILLFHNFKNIDESYQHIFDLLKAEIIQSKSTPWQTKQKGGECDLRWILAYLKNKMSKKEYKVMLLRLRKDCLEIYKKNSSYEDDSKDQTWCKQARTLSSGAYYENIFIKGVFLIKNLFKKNSYIPLSFFI